MCYPKSSRLLRCFANQFRIFSGRHLFRAHHQGTYVGQQAYLRLLAEHGVIILLAVDELKLVKLHVLGRLLDLVLFFQNFIL